MADIRSYLAHLKFDPKLENTPWAKYLTNFRYVLLLILIIYAVGTFSFINLPRRLNPEVEIPIVSVTTILPGAGPADVESLVSEKIEDEISSVENVSKVTSVSAQNVSQIVVEFTSNTDPEKAKDDVRSQVDTISDLPEDAENPMVQKLDFENQPVWTFLITTDSDEASLFSFAKELEDKIEKLPSIKNVQVTGGEEEEIQILVNKNTQKEFNLNTQTLTQAVKAAIPAYPAGTVATENSSYILAIDPQITKIEDLRDLNLILNGEITRLGDIAKVSLTSKPNQAKTFFAQSNTSPQRAVSFSVFKTDSVNINMAVADVEKVTEEIGPKYDNKFKIVDVLNFSKLIDEQFEELLANFRDTIILVFITLFIFLGIRQALIVALAIPLSFLVTFTVMNATGISLNFLSLFSLVLALGLLVDDAIVVVSAVTAYWRIKKFTPNQTGLLVLRDFIVPIWSTTTTAVWAFLPLLIAAGIIGEFIKSIPIVVSTTLLASTAIAILIILPSMVLLLKPQIPNRVKILLSIVIFLLLTSPIAFLSRKNPLLPLIIVITVIFLLLTYKVRSQLAKRIVEISSSRINTRDLISRVKRSFDQGIFDSEKFAHKYQRVIDKVLASRSAPVKTLAIVIIFALFSYLLLPIGFVRNEFFPKADEDQLYVAVELPPGTSLDSSTTVTQNLVNKLSHEDEVKFAMAEIGRTGDFTSFFPGQSPTNNILFTLILNEGKKRKPTASEIAQNLRNKYSNFPQGKLSVVEQTGGPPAGAEVVVNLIGEDLTVLNTEADEIIAFMEKQPELTNIEKSIKPSSAKLVFVPDKVRMVQNGITEDVLSLQLRTFASGFKIDDIKLNGTSHEINLRTGVDFENPAILAGMEVQTRQGNIPLAGLGEFVLKPNPSQITRENGERMISVMSAVKAGNSVSTANKKVLDFTNENKLPEGYRFTTGGINEENQESVKSIFQAMGIAALLIATTMILQFGSYRKAAIVLTLIPLAISGVFIIFALTQTPLTFPTLIGILALFGIVVYQAMLIVDKINKNLKIGMRLKAAISDAAASRVEPIMFGTITTVMGLIPITLSDPLWRGLGGAIIAGLLFSGIIMLLFIPVVYYLVYRKEVK